MDFTWSASTTSGPSDWTYNVYPTAVSATMTVNKPTVAGTTCDNNPTVTWFYKAVGGSTWVALSSNDHVTSTTSTTLVFNSALWEWGDQADG